MGNQARRLDPYLLLLPHCAHCLRPYCYPPDGHSRKDQWINISYGLGLVWFGGTMTLAVIVAVMEVVCLNL